MGVEEGMTRFMTCQDYGHESGCNVDSPTYGVSFIQCEEKVIKQFVYNYGDVLTFELQGDTVDAVYVTNSTGQDINEYIYEEPVSEGHVKTLTEGDPIGSIAYCWDPHAGPPDPVPTMPGGGMLMLVMALITGGWYVARRL